jgi:hypothetical protein
MAVGHTKSQIRRGDFAKDKSLETLPRVRGSRNRLSEAVICALLRHFSKHGEKAIAKLRQTQAAAYLKVLATLVPKAMKLEHTNSLSRLCDEQLDQATRPLRKCSRVEPARARK